MSFTRSTSSLFALLFALLLQTAFGVDPLFHICSTTSENFTTNNSPYEANLNKLMSYLYLKAPPTGFGLGSIGFNNYEKPYGLAFCRGDISTNDCKSCVASAIHEIRLRCPYNKGAIIWYDNCLLKYSNDDFFGHIDNKNKFSMWNTKSVSDPITFNTKVKELLSQLVDKASLTTKMYASGDLEIGESKTLYGLAQCTRDLSSYDCKKCLDDAVSELPSCCDGKEGGRVVGGICNIGYEIYPFINA